jgi:hypothetical protein
LPFGHPLNPNPVEAEFEPSLRGALDYCAAPAALLMAATITKLTSASSGSQISRLFMCRIAQTMVLIFWMVLAISEAWAIDTPQVLTTTAQRRSLTAEEAARAIPVSVTGVVTLAEPTWGGRFLVQDPTRGAFVNSTDNPHPLPGGIVNLARLAGYTVYPGWRRYLRIPDWPSRQ